MAVWRIRSLHLSRTGALYLVGSMTYGVVWDQVYSMLRPPALPESRAFTTYTGDDTAIHGAACYLPAASATCTSVDHPHPRTSCSPGINGCIGCLSRWMVHRGMRLCTSIAPLVAPLAPTNYLGGGYPGATKSGRPSTRPPKKSILMMSCARPQP